eukprot:c10191_g1_i1.p1 GENE.c10191_g1_i1~~c10191_g1_i1.p1  ORF type:complete len:188 (-),score=40.56 c10191_g1_i1:366-929(-)
MEPVDNEKPPQSLKETANSTPIASATPAGADDDEMYGFTCCGKLKLGMAKSEFPLFFKKVLFVFVLTYALVPLIRMKSRIPKLSYTIFLVALHVFILFIYFYRVKLRKLDADWKSLLARLMGLALTIAMLLLAAENEQGSSLVVELLLMLLICLIHTVVLLLLMVRVRYIAKPIQERLLDSSSDPQA